MTTAAPASNEKRLDELRALMAAHSPPLHAVIVPSEDAHQSEYVSERDKRREFISGFSGSAGLAVIATKEALLWTDGRYFLQAGQQLSERWKLMRMGEDPPVETWIADNLPDDAIVGIDPWCISVDSAQKYEQAFSKKHQTLFQLSSDLVDEIWKDRPPNSAQPIILYPVEFAGRSVAEKLKELREKLRQENTSGVILTALDEVSWLYNIRGDDVHYTPVVQSYAIVTLHSAFFYVDKRKLTAEVQNHMTENGIDIREYDMVQSDVSLLASGQLTSSAANGTSHGEEDINKANDSKIWIDSNSCCLALYSKLSGDQVVMQRSPIALPKALKNHVELDGLRKAHIRDGAAVVQYLAWLDNQDLTSRVLSRATLLPYMGTPARALEDAVSPVPGSQDAASTISTAQILRSSGYLAAEPTALRALSEIASCYITSLGRVASAIAQACGRTEPNLLDLTLALEDHAVRGFPGASNPTHPVLRSGVLLELVRFVGMVKEVPFAKLVPRMRGGSSCKGWDSFAAARKVPPLRHVPSWLPCFPEEQEPDLEAENEEETKGKWEALRLSKVESEETMKVNCDGKEGRGVVPQKREKVRFHIGERKRPRRLDKCDGDFTQSMAK